MKRIATILFAVAIVPAPLALSADAPDKQGHEQHRHHEGREAHAGHMLKGYLEVSGALSTDDLAAAKLAAAEMAEHDENSSLAKFAKALAKSKDIKAARGHFQDLSRAAIDLAKSEKQNKYIVMHCPMVKDGRGDWLQIDTVVKNPYMGKKMLSCGGQKKRKKK